MVTQFLTVEIALQGSPAEMQRSIEVALGKHGDPLRWAITDVNVTTQKVIVEAIVTREANG